MRKRDGISLLTIPAAHSRMREWSESVIKIGESLHILSPDSHGQEYGVGMMQEPTLFLQCETTFAKRTQLFKSPFLSIFLVI